MAKIFFFFFPLLFFLVFTTTITSAQPPPSPPYAIHPSDLSALREIKNSLAEIPSVVSPSNFLSSWNFTNSDPCSTFAGVTCSLASRRVTILALGTGLSGSLGLSGTLSRAISRLSELTQLILYAGFVTGPIPSDLGTLYNLRVLYLSSNRLTGPIPASIFSLPNLHTLDLSHNQLTGTVAPVMSAAQLRVLVLAGNKLNGQIPRTCPDGLLHLDLSGNLFTGDLPERLPPSLRYLSVSNNRLWGPLNHGSVQLGDLSYLDLSSNSFDGEIPPELFDMNITYLFLQRNNFSGGLPLRTAFESMFQMAGSSATTVDLSHNHLTGAMSTSLVNVQALFLNNNALTGDVPREYVESVKNGVMKTLYLQHNYLTGFPSDDGSSLPDTAAVCVSYNCMTAPPPSEAVEACPSSAGDQVARPEYQCARVRNGGHD